jgi:site-specific recombinase XerD
MAITINLVLLKSKRRPDGSIPVYIRITENRKSRFKSTGVFLQESEWDQDNQVVILKGRGNRKAGIRERKAELQKVQNQLRRMLMDVEETKDHLERSGGLTIKSLMAHLNESQEADMRTIIGTCERYRAYLRSEDRYWERRHFVVMIRDIRAFIDKGASGDVSDLTAEWIQRFQAYLMTINSARTVRKKAQRLSGMVRWMVKTGQITNNPFQTVDRVKADKGDTKVKLSIEQIRAIEQLDLPEASPVWHVRNYFLFSFYNAGIRFGDLCTLRWRNIIDGRLTYRMHKTGGEKSIQLLPASEAILDHYRSTDQKPDDFIFPILDQDHPDPMELRRRISSRNVIVNRRLKDLAEMAKIQATVSFHVSRHSFAHYALTKGMDLYSISKALGHSDLKVTQDYIKSFDEQLLDKSMRSIFS